MIKAKMGVWIAAALLIVLVMTKEGMDLSVGYIISLKALHILPVTLYYKKKIKQEPMKERSFFFLKHLPLSEEWNSQIKIRHEVFEQYV